MTGAEMANLDRVRVAWTGFPGAPGVSTFYSTNAPSILTALHGLYSACAGLFPTDVNIQVEGTGDIVEPLSGDLMGTWTATAPAVIAGSNGDPYSAPTGALIRWLTGDVLDGHRLKGATYLVPIAANSFDLTGSLSETTLTTIRAAASDYMTYAGGNTVVWHRTRKAKAATAYHPAVTERAGGYSVFTGSVVPDRAVILRSRRD